VLDAWLSSLEAAGRRDLARFLLATVRGLLGTSGAERTWVRPDVLKELRLAERTRTQRAALSLLSTLERLQGWERVARGVGYFDEGYAAAQLWKAEWEAQGGEALCERGRAIRRELDPLRL
jgi:hypothetical protein